MRIVHIYGPVTRMHGATKWLMSFASELTNQGHESRILCSEFTIEPPYWLTAPVATPVRGSGRPASGRNRIVELLRNYLGTLRLVREIPCDAETVVLHAEGTVLLAPFVRRRLPGAQLIYYCYQPPRELYDLWDTVKRDLPLPTRLVTRLAMPLYKWLDRALVGRCDAVLVWSREYEDYARAIYGDHNYRRIPAGVDFGMFETDHADHGRLSDEIRRDADFVILMNATLTRKKNVDLLIRLIAGLHGRGWNARGVVIGEGPLQTELTALADALGVADRFRFAGYVSQERLPAYYHAADLLVYLEPNGAWSMSIIEAGAAHKPVLVAPGGSMETLVIDGTTGCVVDDETDIDDLCDQTERLAADPALRRTLGENNYRHCRQFSLEESARRFVDAVNALDR